MRRLFATTFVLLSFCVAVICCGGGLRETPITTVASAQPLPAIAAPFVAPPLDPFVGFTGPIPPPLTLTASDGTGLRLMKLTARAVVDDPLAFTELALTFENPSARSLEGTFSITLPAGAAVSRFAMKLGDEWQEGEVVELEAARRAYEDFLHRRQDPALLEQGAGNQFTARVFPIPANGQKQIIISYSQETGGAASPYALPLRGLPEIGEIDAELALTTPGAPLTRLHERSYTPSGDLGIDSRYVTRRAGIRSGNFVIARVTPPAVSRPDPLSSVVLLVDTSASRALGFASELVAVREIARLVKNSGTGAQLVVACFDQTTDAIYTGDAATFGDAQIIKIHERGALGASDLGKALAWARANANGSKRVIIIGDGVATAGSTQTGELATAAAALKTVGVERLDVVALGGIRDDVTLHRLATAGLARDGVVVDASTDSSTVVRRLKETTRSGIDVKVDGATFVWPSRLDGFQWGDEALVYAEVPANKPVRVSLGGAPAVAVETTQVEHALVERAWAKAKIASLLDAEQRGDKPDAKKEIVALSVSKRVLSPYTALLVLETEADYARFKIDRHALADVMSVDHGKITLAKRADIHAPVQPHDVPPQTTQTDTSSSAAQTHAPPPPLPESTTSSPQAPTIQAAEAKVDESSQGFGTGHGRLGGAHQTVAQIRQGATTVNGRLPPEVIQRIVRQNFGRFRLCYENGLRGSPNLAGRVSVRFIIDRAGNVSSSADAGSDLPNAGVVSCVVRGFSNLSFPQPEAGIVTVVYPIIFSPGDHGTPFTPGAPPIEKPAVADPYDGRFKAIMEAIDKHDVAGALADANKWRAESPGDQMAIVALGEALEANKDYARAARAYGSLIDLFPARADVRRFAGERLERVSGGLELATDSYEKAVAQRPDHPSSHRLFAYALVKRGELAKAFDVIVKGAARTYPEDRFPGVDKILHEDIGLIAAAWIKSEPARRAEILAKVKDAKGIVESAPSIRFVLTWETDANDVDFHIYDAKGGHAFFAKRKLASGGELYADVTTGYGPECFTIRLPRAQRSTYTLQANYYSRGPMGFGMGKLEVIDHDGNGGLTFEEHPYVVMIDQAFVNLGVIKR